MSTHHRQRHASPSAVLCSSATKGLTLTREASSSSSRNTASMRENRAMLLRPELATRHNGATAAGAARRFP